MQISFRPHLIAGTAAVVVAGAIATTPAIAITLPSVHAPSRANVALAAFDSPLAQLLDTLDMATTYLFDATNSPIDINSWSNTNFGFAFGSPPANYPMLPEYLKYDFLGGYQEVGAVAQFTNAGLPIIRELLNNAEDYLTVTGNALFQSGSQLAQSAWVAAGQALTGNYAGAVTTLTSALSEAGSTLMAAGTYVFQNVAASASNIVATLSSWAPQALSAIAAQVATLTASATAVITNTVTALSLGNVEAAWNAAVDGLLGPSGIPGTLLNLTIGPGVQTGPITTYPPDLADILAVYAPSVRSEVQILGSAIVFDLQTQLSPAAAMARTTARSATSAIAAHSKSVATADISAKAGAPRAAHGSTRLSNSRMSVGDSRSKLRPAVSTMGQQSKQGIH